MTTRRAYLREIHGGLASRVGAADDVDLLIAAGNGLGRAGSIIDAGALQLRHSGDIQFAPLHAGSDHQGVAGNFGTVSQFHDPVLTFGTHAHGMLRG